MSAPIELATGRRPGLDVLRVVAALGVAVTHVAFATGVVNPQRWSSPLRWYLPRLDVGVSVFFVLSGFLVGRPFVAAVIEGGRRPAVGRFLARRLVRILPLYWVVLGVTLSTTDRLPSTPRLLADTFLVHIYRPAWAIGPITQSWTLATELAFYAVLPAWAAWQQHRLTAAGIVDPATRARRLVGDLAAWIVVALAYRVAVVAVTDQFVVGSGSVDLRGALLTWLPNHLDHFAAGLALSVWSVAGWPLPSRSARVAAGAVALGALAVVSNGLGLPPYFTGFDAGQTVGRHLANLVIGAASVGAVALAPARASRLAAGPSRLAGRVAVAAGIATYGIYLWHQWVTERWLEWRDQPIFTAPFPTTLVVVVGVSAVLAAVGYRLVERPAMGALRADAIWRGEPRVLRAAPALDGLRGLAILAVLATHVVFLDNGRETWSLRGGFLGVDVFLSLSGFLIAATLLREVDRTATIDLGRYGWRRARRLVPPLVAFLLIHLIVALALGDAPGEQLLQSVLALGFVGNWQLTAGHQPPYDLVHLWSLAVEAQLYLLCGVALWWARRNLDRVRLLLVVAACAVVVVATWRIVATRAGGDLRALYQRTDLRADALFVGIAAAVVWRARLVPHRVAGAVGSLAALFVAGAMVVTDASDRWLFLGGFTLIAMGSGATVVAAAQQSGPVARVAGWSPLRWFGRISYSLYLWHLPIYLWVVRALGQDAPVILKAGVAIPASVLAGWLGFALVESRFTHRERGPGARHQDVRAFAEG